MLHYIEGPCNILVDNLSRLHCLVTPAQITEGKKLVEPTEVSIKEEDEAYFLDQEYSGLYDENVWECIECYLNLPDTPHPDENLLNYARLVFILCGTALYRTCLFLQTLVYEKCLFSPLKMMAFHYLPPPVEPW